MIEVKTRMYRIKGLTRILGSQPADPDVRSNYIASKAANEKRGEEENSRLPIDMEKSNLSVFLRDKGVVCICDYVIKGFLKETISVLKSQVNVANGRSKIDNQVMITPEYLHFSRDGEECDVADGDFERPLRAMTMQGPRVSVTASEYLDAGWELTFTIHLLEGADTAKSKGLTFDVIEECLNYGSFKGLGQWRNAQNGRFTWEEIK